MSELDSLRTEPKVKDYTLKVLKAKSNTMLSKAFAAMESALEDPNISNKDKAMLGFKVIENHLKILTKEEQQDFMKINKTNKVLQNNKLIHDAAMNGEGNYHRFEEEKEPELDLGKQFLAANSHHLS